MYLTLCTLTPLSIDEARGIFWDGTARLLRLKAKPGRYELIFHGHDDAWGHGEGYVNSARIAEMSRARLPAGGFVVQGYLGKTRLWLEELGDLLVLKYGSGLVVAPPLSWECDLAMGTWARS